MKKIFICIAVTFALGTLFSAPAPFILSQELVDRAPKHLRVELAKTQKGSAAYTVIAMKILEERIRQKMKFQKFDLNRNEALQGMDSAENYKVSESRIVISAGESNKIFSRHREKFPLLTRYNQSFKFREEIIQLFRQCTPALPENRFHSEFFTLLEFQHIYLENQILKMRKSLR